MKTLVDVSIAPERVPPRTIAAYELVEKLGEQGAAELYLGERRQGYGIVRHAMIKRVPKWRPNYERAREILLDEAMVTACFAHPNLSALLDVGEDAESSFLVLEHVEGTTLERLMLAMKKRHVGLPVELCCLLIAEALRGVSWAHELRGPDNRPLGVVLRDRSPANLLISRTGNVKLTDFSLAVTSGRRQHDTDAGVVKGTYAYLAPEYIAGDLCTVRSDIYALGVMLFELLAGRECFGAESPYDTLAQIVGRGVAWKELERENVPPKLMEIVARATNPCATGRYESAAEMLDLLEEQLLATGRQATPTILARVLSRHGLYEGTGHDTVDESKYAPELRIIRGGSIRVTPPPNALPPPLPIDSISLTDSEIDGLFGEDDEDDNVQALKLEGVKQRPPIATPGVLTPPRVRIYQPEDSGSTQILLFAALLAIALFAAIVLYPA